MAGFRLVEMGKYIVVLVTCASKKEAREIAKRLLDEKLVACANIIDGVRSFFWWKSKIDKAKESLIVAKTARKNFIKIEKTVKGLHSYEVPEIIALPIEAAEPDYLKWIDGSTRR